MGKFIAIATDRDGISLWDGHFGVSPMYTLFDHNGNLVKQIENPYSSDKHHDNPSLIVDLLKDADLFIGKNMGKKSREKLTRQLGIKSILVNTKDIYGAVNFFLEAKKNIDVFEENTKKYEDWFERYKAVYESELNMLKNILPPFKKGIEIGVGSGRFAQPLGIKMGLEPSEKMAEIARKRGIEVFPGFAENLPFLDETFDLVFIAVTICFVKDPIKTLKESYRVLEKDGTIIVAIVDKDSSIGKEYLYKKEKGGFYKNVRFFSSQEMHNMLKGVGFRVLNNYQTLFGNSIEEISKTQGFKEGFGEGGFVAIVGVKK